jgi:hypothetical protein
MNTSHCSISLARLQALEDILTTDKLPNFDTLNIQI